MLSKSDLELAWRKSSFQEKYRNHIITHARFSFPKGDALEEMALISSIKTHRNLFQESSLPNLGSLFSTIDIYTELAQHFVFYKILLTSVKILSRLSIGSTDKIYAFMARKMTMLYFGISDSPNVAFSSSTINCVVNRGGADSGQIMEKVEEAQRSTNFLIPLENEMLRDIL